jgi:hypothetical protein
MWAWIEGAIVMNLSKGRRFVTLALGFAMGVPVLGPAARGDAMGPWNGASASTTVFDQSASQQGATAEASSSKTQIIDYMDYFGGSDSDGVSGSASASATGQPDRLLSVQSQYEAGDPGTPAVTPTFQGPGPVMASASWTNDAVILTPPVGGTLPDSVRLQFALTVTPLIPDNSNLYGGPFFSLPIESLNTVQVRANNQSYTVGQSNVEGPWMTSPPVGNGSSSAFDSVTTFPPSLIAFPDPRDNRYQTIGTFHLDLPLSASGVSAPFNLMLALPLTTGVFPMYSILEAQSAVLALTDVTLPDGTALISKGYGVTFESGMPSPVPEPTSLACWGLVASAAGWVGRRRLRTNQSSS